jgi:hypothetical protein
MSFAMHAFKFLNTEEDVEDMGEDEYDCSGMIDLYCLKILRLIYHVTWRQYFSHFFSPSVLATPVTAAKPMLSPKNVTPRSFNPPGPAPVVLPQLNIC